MSVNRLMLVVGLSVVVLSYFVAFKINPSTPAWARIVACLVFGTFGASIARVIKTR